MMTTVEEIVAGAKLREETITICVAGDLNAEYELLEAQLREAAERDEKPSSLGEVPAKKLLAEQVEALRARMAEHEHTFRFRGMPWRKFRKLRAEHGDDDGDLNFDTFISALLVACSVDPILTETGVEQLLDVLNQAQVDELFGAAWKANSRSVDIPKSALASALTAATEPS